jgi:hypothetical protein
MSTQSERYKWTTKCIYQKREIKIVFIYANVKHTIDLLLIKWSKFYNT